MELSQQAEACAAGTAVSASVARMQAKAAQLSEELHLAQAKASNPSSCPAIGTVEGSHTPPGPLVCPGASMEVASPKQSTATLSATSVFRRLSAASTAATKPAAPSPSDPACQAMVLQCQNLEVEVQLWKVRHAEVIEEMGRHQDSYMRREEQLRTQLAALRQPQESAAAAAAGVSIYQGNNQAAAGNVSDHCSSVRAADGTGPASSGTAAKKGQKVQNLLTLQDMQQQVLEGLDELLQRQRLQMRTEESQQLCQFRGRLAEIEAQLAAFRQAAAAHQDDWMGKTVALREELTATQQIAGKLDAMYKLAEEEAAHLRVQFKAQEDDRQHIIRQLLALRCENTRLKQDQAALQDELDQIMACTLQTEAELPSSNSHLDGTWAGAELGASGAAAASSSNSSHLADTVAEVAGKGSGTGSVDNAKPNKDSSSGRQQTAYQPPRQYQQRHARPFSADTNLQQTQHRQAVEYAATTRNRDLEPAAVEARMVRYSHVIQRLQKLLEVERRQLRHARNAYNAELSKRTELQTLLLDSVQLTKQQHRDAQAACQAQQNGQAQAVATAQHGSFMSRPRSAISSIGVLTRPASAAPDVRQRAGSSRPASAAASGFRSGCNSGLGVSNAQQLDAAAWDRLLNDLLARRQVQELIFKQAFPDFIAEADELSLGSKGSYGPVDGQLQHPEQLLQLFISWQSREPQHKQWRGQPGHQQQQQQHLLWQHEGKLGPPCRCTSASSRSQDKPTPSAGSEASSSSDDDGLHAVRVRNYYDHVGQDASRLKSWSRLTVEEQNMKQCQPTDALRPQGQLLQQDVGSSQQLQQQQFLRPASQNMLTGIMLPGFPARQQLHHTRLHRSRQPQAQQWPKGGSSSCSSRPGSAVAPSAAACSRHMVDRPHSAICSLHGNLDTASGGGSSKTVCKQHEFAAVASHEDLNLTCHSLQVSGPQWTVGAG